MEETGQQKVPAQAGRGTGVVPMSTGPGKNLVSSGPGKGLMKTGVGPKNAQNVISSGPGPDWRKNAPKGRAAPVARFTPDGREVKFTGPTCVSCDEMIIGKVLNVNNKPHHPECFTCCECNKSLVGVRNNTHEFLGSKCQLMLTSFCFFFSDSVCREGRAAVLR